MDGNCFLQGGLFMAGLIVSFGPQNIFVLNTGLSGRYVREVVGVCCLGDFLLAGVGVLGVGALVPAIPSVLPTLRIFAIVMLSYYGGCALLRLRSPVIHSAASTSRGAAIASACAFTFLNPYVYLDTVLLVGARAALFGPIDRYWFGAGAVAASCLWYALLGFGARVFSPFADSAGFSRSVDLLTAAIMALSIALLIGS